MKDEHMAGVPNAERAFKELHLDYHHVLRERPWFLTASMQGLQRLFKHTDGRTAGLLDELAGLRQWFGAIGRDPKPGRDTGAPHWKNEFLPALDGMAIYGLLALRNPPTYIEVGSGNSTRFAARAVADHGLRTRIVSIDPKPRSEIDALCDEVVRKPLEELDPAYFEEVGPDDVVFVDGSHRCLQNSDATVFFLEVLPLLQPGTVYGVHDIFLPLDYPQSWSDRVYSEQYLLAAYLFGGADGDEILLPALHVLLTPELMARLDPIWELLSLEGVQRLGCSFWMQRVGRMAQVYRSRTP